jgi:hypothetical protein
MKSPEEITRDVQEDLKRRFGNGGDNNETRIVVDRAIAKAKPLALSFFADCGETVSKPWLMKGVIAKGETSSWIGPPFGGKSVGLTDLGVHVADGADWRGYRCKAKSGVLIFALERADLTDRRLKGYKQRGKHDLPIAVAGQVLNLMEPVCVEIMLATIRAAEERFGCDVGLIIIDTYAKGIAAGGGDEDKARDQNRVLVNLRRLHELAAVHIAIIGHTGKDEKRGARGSNAHAADTDVMMQLTVEGDVRIIEVTNANDQPHGELTRFKIETPVLEVDEDGDEITTAIVSEEVLEVVATKSEARLTKNQQTMFSILHDVGSAGLTSEEWNQRLREVGIGNRRKADIYDARASLKAKGLIRQYGDRWTAQRELSP